MSGNRITIHQFVLAVVTALVLCAVCVGGVSGADTWDGTVNTSWYNSTQNTFTLTTAEQLAGLAKLVGEGNRFSGTTINLASDLDLSGYEWTPIGQGERTWFGYSYTEFDGTFNGNGHTISGMQVNADGALGYYGLFGVVSGTISDLILTNSHISVRSVRTTSGSLVGRLNGGTVENCSVMHATIKIPEGEDWKSWLLGYVAGGVVGHNDGGSITAYVTELDNELPKLATTLIGKVEKGPIVGSGDPPNSNLTPDAGETPPSEYTIISTIDGNGTISPLGKSIVTPGISFNTTIIPDSGYAIDKIFLNDVNVTQGNVTGDGRDKTVFTIENVMQNYSIHVTFCYSPEFTITIPDSLKLDNRTNTGRMNIIVEDVWIPEKDRILIKVSSSNEFDLVHSWDNNIRLDYELTAGSSTTPLSNNDVVGNITQAEYDAQNSLRIEIPLNAGVKSTPKFAGEYGDTLTFTVIRD